MRAGRILEAQRRRKHARRWERFDRLAPWFITAMLIVDAVYLSCKLDLI